MKSKEPSDASADRETQWMFLKYEFSPQELQDLSMKLACKTQDLAQAEEQKKAAVAQFSERIAECKAEAMSAARKVASGYEMRNVECTVTYDPFSLMARISRNDTGELVQERPIHPDERQRRLHIHGSQTEQ